MYTGLSENKGDEKAGEMTVNSVDTARVKNSPTVLNEFGVKMEDLDFLVKAGSDQKRLLVNNMKELSLDDIRGIYLRVLK